jgi:hypothetical protein
MYVCIVLEFVAHAAAVEYLCSEDWKVCDDGILIEWLIFQTLFINSFYLRWSFRGCMCRKSVVCCWWYLILALGLSYSPPSTAELKNGGTSPPLPHMSTWHSALLIKHRDNFTVFFFCKWYSPWWTLASFTVAHHRSHSWLSSAFQCFHLSAIVKSFSTTKTFYGVGSSTLCPIPNLEDWSFPFCLDQHFWPVQHGRQTVTTLLPA